MRTKPDTEKQWTTEAKVVDKDMIKAQGHTLLTLVVECCEEIGGALGESLHPLVKIHRRRTRRFQKPVVRLPPNLFRRTLFRKLATPAPRATWILSQKRGPPVGDLSGNLFVIESDFDSVDCNPLVYKGQVKLLSSLN